MIRLVVETQIQAPVERCFDLARDMDAHAKTMAKSGERIVSLSGQALLNLGDEVTFEAKHMGIRQRLTAKIIQFDRPKSFTDEMVRGAFRFLRHEHRFEATNEGTKMTDNLQLAAPLGPLGWLAERLFLAGYMKRLLADRGQALKAQAESASPSI